MENRIEIAKKVAEKISGIYGVETAIVDDYNKYGQFQIVAYLDLSRRNTPKRSDFNLRKIRTQIVKFLKEETSISKMGVSIDSPTREYDKYTYCGTTTCIFKGYDRSYIMIDFTVVEPSEQISIRELLTPKDKSHVNV